MGSVNTAVVELDHPPAFCPGCEEEQPFSPFSGEGHVLPSPVLWGKLWVAAAMSRADGEVAERGLWVWKG